MRKKTVIKNKYIYKLKRLLLKAYYCSYKVTHKLRFLNKKK